MIPVELGCPGHLIVARHCRWRRHTQVGNYRISTVGDYFDTHGTRQPLGGWSESFFESMVFETTDEPEADSEGCGCRAVKSWSEIEGTRYSTAGEAQAAHEALIQKYLNMEPADAPL